MLLLVYGKKPATVSLMFSFPNTCCIDGILGFVQNCHHFHERTRVRWREGVNGHRMPF